MEQNKQVRKRRGGTLSAPPRYWVQARVGETFTVLDKLWSAPRARQVAADLFATGKYVEVLVQNVDTGRPLLTLPIPAPVLPVENAMPDPDTASPCALAAWKLKLHAEHIAHDCKVLAGAELYMAAATALQNGRKPEGASLPLAISFLRSEADIYSGERLLSRRAHPRLRQQHRTMGDKLSRLVARLGG